MTDEFRNRLIKVYAEHPLTAVSILERVRRQKGIAQRWTESDLCVDLETQITDQNHPGGLATVLEIARAVGLNAGMSVIDVGTGLGGTPRVLSDRFGCRCLGVELTEG